MASLVGLFVTIRYRCTDLMPLQSIPFARWYFASVNVRSFIASILWWRHAVPRLRLDDSSTHNRVQRQLCWLQSVKELKLALRYRATAAFDQLQLNRRRLRLTFYPDPESQVMTFRHYDRPPRMRPESQPSYAHQRPLQIGLHHYTT